MSEKPQIQSKPDSRAPDAAPKPKRRLLRWVLALVLPLLLAGGGAGFYFWRVRAATAADTAASTAGAHDGAEGVGESSVLTFEPFVVNLADKDGARFLRVTLRLLVAGDKGEELQKDEVTMLRIRSAILELLSAQVADRLVTPEGKADVKKAVAEQASTLLTDTKVIDVLFSEFVVQF